MNDRITLLDLCCSRCICNCCRTTVVKMSQQALEAQMQLLSEWPLMTGEKGKDLLLFSSFSAPKCMNRLPLTKQSVSMLENITILSLACWSEPPLKAQTCVPQPLQPFDESMWTQTYVTNLALFCTAEVTCVLPHAASHGARRVSRWDLSSVAFETLAFNCA